jgi:hypothetical protein
MRCRAFRKSQRREVAPLVSRERDIRARCVLGEHRTTNAGRVAPHKMAAEEPCLTELLSRDAVIDKLVYAAVIR